MNLDSLLSPFQLGSLKVRNRLVLAPMTTYASQPDGNISADELPYLARRAKGFGIVMTAACYVHPHGKAFVGQWGCSDDQFLPSLASAANAIKAEGAAAILQIHHGGRQCPAALCGGRPLSASAIPYPRDGAPVPFAMTEAEIHETIDAYAAAAVRAQKAGYDGVEIHGANTYLLQQFVSPHSNRRGDEWGQNRLKFPLAVTNAVLEAVGPDFAVGYRFSPEETTDPGLSIVDTEALVGELIKLPLSFLHISLSNYAQSSLRNDFEEPVLSRIAKQIAGKVTLIGVGGIKTAEEALGASQLGAEMIAVGRVGLSDPEWPQGLAAHRAPVTRLPRNDMADQLTLPKGLVDKILNTPGWMDVED